MNPIDVQGRSGIAIRPQVGPVRPAQQVEGARPLDGPTSGSERVPAAGISAGPAAPIDPRRVAAIRTAIESGSYRLNPADIADAMIAAGIVARTGE